MRQTDPVTNRDRDAPGPTGDAAAQLPPTDDAPSHEADPDAAGGSTESPGTLPSLLIWQHRLARGYSSAFGTPLAEPSELYDHPWALLCHGTEPDPLFVYANLTAQRLWERTLVDFLGWPSRLTAPAEERTQRAAALSSGEDVRGYEGVRVSSSGRRFRIIDASIWIVRDDAGTVIGQAAAVPRWVYLS